MPFLVFADLHPVAAILLTAMVLAFTLGVVMCICDTLLRMMKDT